MPRADPARSPYCASRHLLRNLDDARATAAQPARARVLRSRAGGARATIPTQSAARSSACAVPSTRRSRAAASTRTPARGHVGLGRMHAALLRCDLDNAPPAVVAAELGLSERQLRRERRAAHDAFLHAFDDVAFDAPHAALAGASVRDPATLRLAQAVELHELGQCALALRHAARSRRRRRIRCAASKRCVSPRRSSSTAGASPRRRRASPKRTPCSRNALPNWTSRRVPMRPSSSTSPRGRCAATRACPQGSRRRRRWWSRKPVPQRRARRGAACAARARARGVRGAALGDRRRRARAATRYGAPQRLLPLARRVARERTARRDVRRRAALRPARPRRGPRPVSRRRADRRAARLRAHAAARARRAHRHRHGCRQLRRPTCSTSCCARSMPNDRRTMPFALAIRGASSRRSASATSRARSPPRSSPRASSPARSASALFARCRRTKIAIARGEHDEALGPRARCAPRRGTARERTHPRRSARATSRRSRSRTAGSADGAAPPA